VPVFVGGGGGGGRGRGRRVVERVIFGVRGHAIFARFVGRSCLVVFEAASARRGLAVGGW